MSKIIFLISKLNECDFNILFKDKNVFVYFQEDEEEIVNFELPIGIDKYQNFIKDFKNSIIDKIDEFENYELKNEGHWDIIYKLKQIEKCLK